MLLFSRHLIPAGVRRAAFFLTLAFATIGRAATPDSAAPAIAHARTLFAEINKGRKDLGDNPLAKDYGADDPDFADALLPVLAELDHIVDAHPESAAALVERARVRLVYQAHFAEQTDRAFDFTRTVQDLEHATELEPANAAAWFELGLAHLAEWRTEGAPTTVMNLLTTAAEKAAAKKTALTAAIHAFSRAIYAQPGSSGLAHLARTWAQRALELGGDPDQTFVDADAAITQELRPTDAAWDAVLHPARSPDQHSANLADAYFLRGKALLSRGQSTAALSDLDHAVKLEPANMSARFERGRLLVRRGVYAGAISDFAAVLAARPDLAEGWLWRGIAHDGAGEIALASADLAEATKRNPGTKTALAKTRYDTAEPNPARGIAPHPVTADTRPVPPGTALDHKNAGNALRGKGDIYGAQREYTFASLIDPQFADAFSNRGSVYSAWRELDLAMVEFDRAIALDPRHRAAYLNRGFLWRELGDHQREREDFDQAVACADSDDRRADALLARGRTLENVREFTAATADYLRATELAPGKADTWSALAYLDANQSRFADAATHLRQVLAIEPKDFHARVVLAAALAILDDEDALAELDTALENATKRDQVDEAAEVIERALQAHPGSNRLKSLKDKIDERKHHRVLYV